MASETVSCGICSFIGSIAAGMVCGCASMWSERAFSAKETLCWATFRSSLAETFFSLHSFKEASLTTFCPLGARVALISAMVSSAWS